MRKRSSMRGRGFKSFMNKVGNFLKRTKLISRLGSAGSAFGIPYVGAVGKMAGAVGYGRRGRPCRRYCRRRIGRRSRATTRGSGISRQRRKTGSGLTLPGGGLKLAGQGRKRPSGRVLSYNAPNMHLTSARMMY